MDVKYDLLKTEFAMCQQQMDKYDQLSSSMRFWAVTLSVASIGWFLQIKVKEVLLLTVFISAVFWFLDAMNKNFREDYKHRRNEVAKLLNSFYNNIKMPKDASSPNLPLHKFSAFAKKIIQPHVFPLYVSLIVIATLLFYLS